MGKVKQTSNYDYFIKLDTKPYIGEWVAIADKKVVSHGKDAQEVYKKARQKNRTDQGSLAKVPEEEILVLKLDYRGGTTITGSH